MGDRVTRIGAGIDHAAIAPLTESLEARHFARCTDDRANRGVVLRLERFGVGNVLVRYHQHVNGHLRIDVAERGHLVVLEHDAGRDLTADDLAEDAVRIWTGGHLVRTINPRAHTGPAPRARARQFLCGAPAARALPAVPQQ